jgi:signal peptidase I
MQELFQSATKHRKLLIRVLLLLALAIVIRRWIWMPTLIIGSSMRPALLSGQIVGVNKLIYLFQAPQRGDVVAVWTGKELTTKRVLALPGEEVAARDGAFYVDGLQLAEAYPHVNDHSNIAAGRLGSDQFVVAGDNRPESLIAIVNRGRIVGRLAPFGTARNRLNRRYSQPGG